MSRRHLGTLEVKPIGMEIFRYDFVVIFDYES
jgi:hypothetical protein